MTWWQAVLSAAGIWGFWLALPFLTTKLGNYGRRYMDRTLWKSLPDASPCTCGSSAHHGGDLVPTNLAALNIAPGEVLGALNDEKVREWKKRRGWK